MSTDTPHARVESAMPGRLRIRLDRSHRHNDAMDRVHDALGARDGIHSVSSNRATGSVLVHYDRAALDRDDVVAMLGDAGIVIGEVARAVVGDAELGQSAVSTRILDALGDLDQRVSRATNGMVDVKLLFPVALGALAVRQIVTQGLGLGTVPGYVLLWYTFDSFYKLHPSAHPTFNQDPDVQTAEDALSEARAADADARAARDEAVATGAADGATAARRATTRADRATAIVGGAASATRRPARTSASARPRRSP